MIGALLMLGSTDSDFADGGTNVKGHVLGIGYALAKNTALAATYFMNDDINYVSHFTSKNHCGDMEEGFLILRSVV